VMPARTNSYEGFSMGSLVPARIVTPRLFVRIFTQFLLP